MKESNRHVLPANYWQDCYTRFSIDCLLADIRFRDVSYNNVDFDADADERAADKHAAGEHAADDLQAFNDVKKQKVGKKKQKRTRKDTVGQETAE
ncbi:hypothetical protein [Spirosoma spitsbergense]|uniref:hypothetical protein n=1 Tax=Spirosoma spitsbergense TaxID=431554 RepID=UPI00037DFED9|nr:hypothetical protein [Spirosoma spitsbergense]